MIREACGTARIKKPHRNGLYRRRRPSAPSVQSPKVAIKALDSALFRHQPLAPDPVQTTVEAAPQAVEELIDLCFADHQWGAYRDAVAQHWTDDDPFRLRKSGNRGADQLSGGKTRPGCLVRHQFDSPNETDAGCFTDQGMLRELSQPRKKSRGHVAHVPNDVAFLIDFNGLQSDSGGHGMARIGEAVTERADPTGLFFDHLAQLG